MDNIAHTFAHIGSNFYRDSIPNPLKLAMVTAIGNMPSPLKLEIGYLNFHWQVYSIKNYNLIPDYSYWLLPCEEKLRII